MSHMYAILQRNIALSLLAAGGLLGADRIAHGPVPTRAKLSRVNVKLSEWKVELSDGTITAGPVTFTITNGGSIPHAFEVEGQGIEKEIELLQPGSSTTLSLSLPSGTYEVYCPVGGDSHKKLGMEAHLRVVDGKRSGSGGYGHAESEESPDKVQSIQVTGGGPVIQILPGPFPFPDSAAPILKMFRGRARRAGVTGEDGALFEPGRADLRQLQLHRLGQGGDSRFG